MANVVNLYGNAASIPLDELATMSKAQLVQCATILHSALVVANKHKFAAHRELEMIQAERAGAEVSPQRKFMCELEGKIAALQEQFRSSQHALRKIAGENGNLKRFISGEDMSKLLALASSSSSEKNAKNVNSVDTPPSSPNPKDGNKSVSFFSGDNNAKKTNQAVPVSEELEQRHHRRSSSGISEMTNLTTPTASPRQHDQQHHNISQVPSSFLSPNSNSASKVGSPGYSNSNNNNAAPTTTTTTTTSTLSNIAVDQHQHHDSNSSADNNNNLQQIIEQEKKKWQKEQSDRELSQKEATKLFIRRTEDQLKQQSAQQVATLESTLGLSNRQAQAKIKKLEDELSRSKAEFSEQARVLRLRENTDVQFLRQMNEKLSQQGETDRDSIFQLKSEAALLRAKLRELDSDMEERIREEMIARLDEMDDDDDEILASLLPAGVKVGNRGNKENVHNSNSPIANLRKQRRKSILGGNRENENGSQGGGATSSSSSLVAHPLSNQKTLVEAETQTESFMMKLVDVIKQREDELRSAKLEIHSLTEQVLKINRDMTDCRRENEELRQDAKKYSGLVNEMQNQMKNERGQRQQQNQQQQQQQQRSFIGGSGGGNGSGSAIGIVGGGGVVGNGASMVNSSASKNNLFNFNSNNNAITSLNSSGNLAIPGNANANGIVRTSTLLMGSNNNNNNNNNNSVNNNAVYSGITHVTSSSSLLSGISSNGNDGEKNVAKSFSLLTPTGINNSSYINNNNNNNNNSTVNVPPLAVRTNSPGSRRQSVVSFATQQQQQQQRPPNHNISSTSSSNLNSAEFGSQQKSVGNFSDSPSFVHSP